MLRSDRNESLPFSDSDDRDLPAPAEIYAGLSRRVIGQETAKKALAVASYTHYLGLAAGDEDHPSPFGRQTPLLIGPTGCGKTYLVHCLADLLGVPYQYVSAAELVEAGYKGTHIETVFQNLYRRCDDDLDLAQQAILFVDELDKCRSSPGLERDVSGTGAQNALLSVLDGSPIRVGPEDSGLLLDTSRILVIAGGAFVGLEDQIRRRLDGGGLGFRGPGGGAWAEAGTAELLEQVGSEDLIDYGLIPELVGRFSAIAPLQPLSEDDLVRILTTAEGSALAAHCAFAESHGIQLSLSEDALQMIARKAAAFGTGARALRSVLDRELGDLRFQLPALAEEGVRRVEITGQVLLGCEEPHVFRRRIGRSPSPHRVPRAPRLRSRALRADAAGRIRRPGRPSFTRTANRSAEWIWKRIDQVRARLDWDRTTGGAKEWWETFEKANARRPALVLRLAEELDFRKATITDFFLAAVYAGTDNIQACLHYFDYLRLKRREEELKRRRRAKEAREQREKKEKKEKDDEKEDKRPEDPPQKPVDG
ncbi:MAG: AAA family ATPase [Planctomycetota bacterium]|nr:MAG: AAA family ATPase [Planctomycetota bacterium]